MQMVTKKDSWILLWKTLKIVAHFTVTDDATIYVFMLQVKQ